MRLRLLLSVLALVCFFTAGSAVAQTTFTSSSMHLPAAANTVTAPVKATPFPQTIAVSGMPGAIANLQVTLNNWAWSNSATSPLEIMLVAPDGTNLVFFGGNCESA